PDVLLRRGRWTNELNFLGWQPFAGPLSPELPAGSRVRCSLQWREPHDKDFFIRPGDDPYLNPLAKLRLVVLRQRDAEGKTLPADDLEVVTRSSGLPQRLDNQPNSSTYELAVEFTPAKGARYALRIERQVSAVWKLTFDPATGREGMGQLTGLAPTGIRPLGAATLPELEKKWELRARLFVETIDDTSAREGRPVWLDFATSQGTVGLPGDARAVVTVGAADPNDRPQPYTAKGPPANLDYLIRPNVLAYDRLLLGEGQPGGAYGSSVATAFAAGIAAALRSAGMTREQFLQHVQRNPGAVLKAPRRQ
ncbi:MAG TPA: S8 family serine peptidase, partial [Gemmataceae bacterium]|nr:S8 family serine peptidase [Gemmataceae bacterium]